MTEPGAAAHFAVADYKEILLFLGTAGVVAPLFRKLRLSPIYGFLVAGFLLGPHGLGFLAGDLAAKDESKIASILSAITLGNVAQIEPIAEFGVVFLLFMIGLELSGSGCAACAGCLRPGRRAGRAQPGVAAGAALRLAKPAPRRRHRRGAGAVLDRHRHCRSWPSRSGSIRRPGRATFSVLLFQDLAVAPLLVTLTLLGRARERLRRAACSLALRRRRWRAGLVVRSGRLVLRPMCARGAAESESCSWRPACWW